MINIQEYAKQAKQTTSKARQAYENAKRTLIQQINDIDTKYLDTLINNPLKDAIINYYNCDPQFQPDDYISCYITAQTLFHIYKTATNYNELNTSSPNPLDTYIQAEAELNHHPQNVDSAKLFVINQLTKRLIKYAQSQEPDLIIKLYHTKYPIIQIQVEGTLIVQYPVTKLP